MLAIRRFWFVSSLVAFLAAGSLVFILYCMTAYVYSGKPPEMYRVNRFTGVREISTAAGWCTESEYRSQQRHIAESESAKKLKHLKALAKARDLGKVMLGKKSEIKAECTVAYIDSKLHCRLFLMPFNGTLQAAVGRSGNPSITIELKNSDGFILASKVIDIKGLTRAMDKGQIIGMSEEGSIAISERLYLDITAFSVSWRF